MDLLQKGQGEKLEVIRAAQFMEFARVRLELVVVDSFFLILTLFSSTSTILLVKSSASQRFMASLIKGSTETAPAAWEKSMAMPGDIQRKIFKVKLSCFTQIIYLEAG